MNLEPWALRGRMRLVAVFDELAAADVDGEILGLAVVCVRVNADGDRHSSVSGSLGPCCSANDMAAALLVESEAMARGEGVRSVDRELTN